MEQVQQLRETLPDDVRPIIYDLRLAPNLDARTFEGAVSVTLDVRRATANIVLNAAELKITDASVEQDGIVQPVLVVGEDVELERATLAIGKPLVPDLPATLRMKFAGTLNDRLNGFYVSEYEVNGEKRVMATTQFEPAHARRAFPCWDEPSAKARFNVTLDVPVNLVAISNAHVADTIMYGERAVVRFETTPIMSTYLLAFIVGDLEYVERVADGGTVIRVWTTPGKKAFGEFALDVAEKALAYFTEYFERPYVLPKMDLIAIPDFAFGAMENWGAITFRETALLIDPKNSSQGNRQRVAEVVTHEIAHQWFGNLVTMEWWNDLWLNESFADWIATKAVDRMFPEWDLWTQFVAHDMCSAMRLDGMHSTHPIDVPISRVKDIDEVFDQISYSKGGAVLRMLEAHLGEAAFRDGLRIYMQRHAFGNTEATDLWRALEDASKKPVGLLMSSWIQQPGYPVLDIQGERRGNGLMLHVQQRRFLYDVGANETTTWSVPMNIVTHDDTRTDLVPGRSMVTYLRDHYEETPSWLHANAGRTGFYRVNYDNAGWNAVLRAVASKSLTSEERLGVEDDAYALCRAGKLTADRYLAIAAAYADETEYAVWSSLLGNLGQLRGLLLDAPELRAAVRAFSRELVQRAVENIGWDPSSQERHTQIFLRSLVIGTAGMCGHEGIIEEAELRFSSALRDPESVRADIRSTIYGIAARHGRNTGHLDDLLWLYRRGSLQQEKDRVLGVIGYRPDRESLERVLQFALSPEVRSQDTVSVVGSVAGNDTVPATFAWEFVKANWQELERRYRGNAMMLGRFLTSTVNHLATEGAAADVEAFFREHPAEGLDRTIAQAVEKIRLNAAWLTRNLAPLRAWHEQRVAVTTA